MAIISLQCFCFLIVAGAAVCLARSIVREKVDSLQDVMRRFSDGAPLVSDLSDRGMFNEGLDCPTEELWERSGGLAGMWTMYCNLAVLIDVLHQLDKRYDLTGPQERGIRRTCCDAMHARLTIAKALLTLPTLSSSLKTRPMAQCCEVYINILARTSLAVHDVDRRLMERYAICTGQRYVGQPRKV